MKRKIAWSAAAVLLALLVGAGWMLAERDVPGKVLEARYASPASRFVELPGGARVHLRDQGNPQGQPLLLIHGANSSLQTWEPWVQDLGGTFRIITFDLPGHGLTGPVPGGDYSVPAMVRFLEELRESLHLAQFDLGGNSHGGRIAWQYALAHPDRVRRLVLVDASGFPDIHPPLALKLVRIPLIRNLFRWITPRSMVRSTLLDMVYDPKVVTPEMVDRIHDLLLRDGNRDAMLARAAAPVTEEEAKSIPNIRAPTLILWGAQDRVLPMENAQRFHDQIRGSVMRVYGHAGHLPMEELPKETADEVRVFLSMAKPW